MLFVEWIKIIEFDLIIGWWIKMTFCGWESCHPSGQHFPTTLKYQKSHTVLVHLALCFVKAIVFCVLLGLSYRP